MTKLGLSGTTDRRSATACLADLVQRRFGPPAPNRPDGWVTSGVDLGRLAHAVTDAYYRRSWAGGRFHDGHRPRREIEQAIWTR